MGGILWTLIYLTILLIIQVNCECQKSQLEQLIPNEKADIVYSSIGNGTVPVNGNATIKCKGFYEFRGGRYNIPMSNFTKYGWRYGGACYITKGCEKLPLNDEDLTITYESEEFPVPVNTTATSTCKDNKAVHNPKLQCNVITFANPDVKYFDWNTTIAPYCYEENKACNQLSIDVNPSLTNDAAVIRYRYGLGLYYIDLGTDEKIPENGIAQIKCPCKGHITPYPYPKCESGSWNPIPSCVLKEGIEECEEL